MLQDNPLWHRLTARLHIFVALIVALVAAVVFALAAGEGDFRMVGVILGVAVALALLSTLGSSYWLVIPFAFVSQLAAIPVGGKLLELPEVITFICLVYFLIQFALRRQQLTIFRVSHVPVQLFAAWALIVFINNPVGLSELGSSLGGLRFYGKIGLALMAFLIIANQKVNERDCQWIIALMLAGTLLSAGQEVFFLFFPRADSGFIRLIDEEGFYTWHQILSSIPLTVIPLLFCRYRSSEIFSFHRIWLLGVFLASVVLILISGKRSAVATIPLFAATTALVRREFGYLFLWIAGAVMAAIVIVVGQGDFFHLPLAAQRAVSFLPGNWDPEITSLQGGRDDFRDALRIMARAKIAGNPWLGTGFKVDQKAMEMALMKAPTGIEDQVQPYALGSAWHNTWLGYAADFGIPASILVGIIYLTVVYRSWRVFRSSPSGSLIQTLALYILIFTVRDIIFSQTSGHTALDAYSRWWMYGLLVALDLTNRRNTTPVPAAIPRSATLQPVRAPLPARPPAVAPRRTAS